MKTLLLENLPEKAKQNFQKAGLGITSYNYALNEKQLSEVIKDIEILGIKSRTKITDKILSKAAKLKVIGTFSIGVKHIDIDACNRLRIPIFNDPKSSINSVAELTIGNIIALSRRIHQKSITMHNGIWKKDSIKSFEIKDKTLGIIGYGNIGSTVSKLAEKLGMRIFFFDIDNKKPVGNATKCDTLNELLKTSDVITIHVDGRKENTHLIDFKEFDLMQDNVILINTSRGHVVNFSAVLENLKSKKLHSAAFDVHPDEPNSCKDKYKSILQKLPNVILTPHIGGYTEEAQLKIGNFVSQKILTYITKNDLQGCVNETALG